ncbi:MAG: N-6 DNA methylase, partial [Planctomycetota bacterium]
MPADLKPLFRTEALRPELASFTLTPAAVEARGKLKNWAGLLAEKRVELLKETELLPSFLGDVFCSFLGYRGPADGNVVYSLKREALVEVDGKRADGALGRFSLMNDEANIAIVIEGKGPRDPLDRPFAGRKRSAVEQALQYAVNLRINWYLVTNLREIRLYNKSQDQFTLERFDTIALASDESEQRRFAFLMGADRVAPSQGGNHLDALLTSSRRIGQKLTKDYYAEYAALRRQTLDRLRAHNPGVSPVQLLAATQKMLDRILFIAFCEDRGLLPVDIIEKAYKHSDPWNPQPIWKNFLGLFRSVDVGNEQLRISRYNGGLFAPDEFLERLNVPDEICLGFKKLADYEYGAPSESGGKQIDVEILGHIFEQSISDLEEMQKSLAESPAILETVTSEEARSAPSKRKKEGAFYTPAFVTRFIVSETLRPVLEERFQALRQKHDATAPKSARNALINPRSFDPVDLSKAENAALKKFWHDWTDELDTVRIVDPSCGSGAFLIEAFDQMFAEYQTAQANLEALGEGKLFLDVRKAILTKNLFGMDLNSESVEIARLSCWIKTAERDKILTALDDNIKQGNSAVASPTPEAAWRQRFPAAFAAGGFDVVIGNPPYVRQEWIKADKPFLQENYQAYDGVADLYVYFYELGLKLLKPGGRLGFISSNSFARSGSATALRKFLTSTVTIERYVDLGDTQIFSDAKDVYPGILVVSNRMPMTDTMVKATVFRRADPVEQLSEIADKVFVEAKNSSLAAEGWRFERPEIREIRSKLESIGPTLGTYVSNNIFLGIKTGLNEAFVVSEEIRKTIIADGRSSSVIKPLVGGQHIRRWVTEDSGQWVILLPSGSTFASCGSNDMATARAWLRATYPGIEKHLSPFEAAAS